MSEENKWTYDQMTTLGRRTSNENGKKKRGFSVVVAPRNLGSLFTNTGGIQISVLAELSSRMGSEFLPEIEEAINRFHDELTAIAVKGYDKP